jgi:hypothetical protein
MKKWDIFHVVILVAGILISFYNLALNFRLLDLGLASKSIGMNFISSSATIMLFSMILLNKLRKKKKKGKNN